MNAYEDRGYENRDDYLKSLAEDYGVEIGKVRLLADLLGPDEDFDGLVFTLEDISMEESYMEGEAI